jgi:hypothetical protein
MQLFCVLNVGCGWRHWKGGSRRDNVVAVNHSCVLTPKVHTVHLIQRTKL